MVHVVTICLETILILEFCLGDRALKHFLHIILDISGSALIPCLLPTLMISLAAESAICLSSRCVDRVSERIAIAAAASAFLFLEDRERYFLPLEISIPHNLEAMEFPTSSIDPFPSMRINSPFVEYHSANGAVCS